VLFRSVGVPPSIFIPLRPPSPSSSGVPKFGSGPSNLPVPNALFTSSSSSSEGFKGTGGSLFQRALTPSHATSSTMMTSNFKPASFSVASATPNALFRSRSQESFQNPTMNIFGVSKSTDFVPNTSDIETSNQDVSSTLASTRADNEHGDESALEGTRNISPEESVDGNLVNASAIAVNMENESDTNQSLQTISKTTPMAPLNTTVQLTIEQRRAQRYQRFGAVPEATSVASGGAAGAQSNKPKGRRSRGGNGAGENSNPEDDEKN